MSEEERREESEPGVPSPERTFPAPRGQEELPPRNGPALRPHDFERPRSLGEERLRALDSIHRKFARAAASMLSVMARTKVQVDLGHIGQRTYAELIRGLQNPTCLFLVYCLPERLPFVLEIKPAVLFPLLERILGGRGDLPAAGPAARPMTRIEQDIARSI